MASIQTTLVNNEVSKPLFDMAKGETPFEINSRIGYSGDSSSDISLKPLNYEQKDEKVAFSGGQLQLKADRARQSHLPFRGGAKWSDRRS